MSRLLAFHSLLVVSSSLLLTFPTASQAGCDCNWYPGQGTYSAQGASIEVSHLDGTDLQCPSQIQLRGDRGPDAPDIKVNLRCDGMVWSGTEPAIWNGKDHGTIRWVVTPGNNDTIEMPKAVSGNPQLENQTVGFGGPIKIRFAMPPSLRGIDRSAIFAVEDLSGPPACICHEAREALLFVETALRAFNAVDILDFALKNDLGAADGKNDAITPDGKFKPGTETPPEEGYESIVYGRIDRAMAINGLDGTSRSGVFDGNFGDDTMQSSTKSDTCAIPEPQLSGCFPGVLIESVMAHEQVHRDICLRINKTPFQLPDGRMVYPAGGATGADAGRLGYGVGIKTTQLSNAFYYFDEQTRTRYEPPHYHWANDPRNTQFMEVQAYTKEKSILEQFLAENCED